MRLTPGAIALGLHQTFSKGLRVAWYRDVVRWRILNTPPVEGTEDTRCEIHALTSQHDWINLVWTLKSFYLASNRKYALCIHEDGSLTDRDLVTLSHHFPAARIIRRKYADEVLDKELANFPRIREFRRTNLLAPKLFDFVKFLEAERLGVFDSDLLFFSSPEAFLERVENPAFSINAFNSDFNDAYTVSADAVRRVTGDNLQPLINSGFGLVQPDSIRWNWIEEFLCLRGILDSHPWRIEQTLFALCSSRYGVELLPKEYNVRLEPGIGSRPMRHYVGAIRHLMYSEGISTLLKQGMLEATFAGRDGS